LKRPVAGLQGGRAHMSMRYVDGDTLVAMRLLDRRAPVEDEYAV